MAPWMNCILHEIEKMPVKHQLGPQLGLWTQIHYEAPGDPHIKTGTTVNKKTVWQKMSKVEFEEAKQQYSISELTRPS